MDFFAIDIETIPNQLIQDSCLPQFDPESVKHGNTKDPDKRKAKEDEERAKFEQSKAKTMSLDPAYCSVCTFAGVWDSDAENKGMGFQMTEQDGHDDYEVVLQAVEMIHAAYLKRIPIVTFNGTSFDLPVLQFRAMAQDVPVDPLMFQKLTRKYSNDHHFDLMQILAGWDRQRWHGQNFYLRLFGIGSKGDMDGSKVFDAYKAGEYEKIRQYCIQDAVDLSKLFSRVQPWFVDSSKNKEKDNAIS